MSNSLIVIDMQPGFSTSNEDWLINNISKCVRLAVSEGWDVHVLEFSPDRYGRTHYDIMKYVTSEPLIKHRDSGWHLLQDRLSSGTIVWTGVNTCACVKRTITALFESEHSLANSLHAIPIWCVNQPAYWDGEHNDEDWNEGVNYVYHEEEFIDYLDCEYGFEILRDMPSTFDFMRRVNAKI